MAAEETTNIIPEQNKESVPQSEQTLLKLPKKKFIHKIFKSREAKLKNRGKTKKIDKELKIIYRDENNKMPNMTKLEFQSKNRTSKLAVTIIGALFLIFIVSFLGFLFFMPNPKFTGNKVELEIKAPFGAIAGENIPYEINLTNNEKISLTNLLLTVYLPSGYIYNTANIAPQSPTDQNIQANSTIKTWQITDLSPGQTQALNINGKIVGALNSKQTISATLSYFPANFSSEFQKNTSISTDIIDNFIQLEIDHPSQIANKEKVEITINLLNKSDQYDLNNLALEFNYPTEFAFAEAQISEPDSTAKPEIIKAKQEEASPKILEILSFLPQTKKQIKFKGEFNAEKSGPQEFTILAKLKGPQEEYFNQKEEKFSLEIIKDELLINLIISGSDQNKPVNFGQTLNYLLRLQNKSKKALGDIKIRAVLDSVLLDWPSLIDGNNGVRENEQILWTKDQIPKLALLLPEEDLEINFQINLLANPEKKYKQEDYKVTSFFETQINKVDNNDSELVSQSQTIINEINTNLDLKIDARYFDDRSNTLGSGPLPPIVGQKTAYKIFWTITNSLHEISDIEIKAKLPDSAGFEDKQIISTGNLIKNQSNEILWQIARIPTSVDKSTAEFEVSITPQASDIGKILSLLSDIQIQAADVQTKGIITKSFTGLTTNLDSDPLGKNKGLILSE